MTEDFHSILGVTEDASPAAIRHAYLELAKECHPDLHPNDPLAAEKFKQIQRAFETLYKPWRWPFRRTAAKSESLLATLASRPRPRWKCDPCSRELVLVPAIYLILLGIFWPLSVVVAGLLIEGRTAGRRNQPQLEQTPQEQQHPDELLERAKTAISLLLSAPWAIAWGAIVVLGGINMLTMRIHTVAVAVSILVMIPCCVGPWCVPGLFVGAWSLTRLYDYGVKDAFWG